MGNIASSRSTSGGILSYVGQIAMKAHPALGHHFPRILTIKTRVLSSTASSMLTRWSRISTLSSDCRHQEQKQPMYACLSGVYQPKKSPPMKDCCWLSTPLLCLSILGNSHRSERSYTATSIVPRKSPLVRRYWHQFKPYSERSPYGRPSA